MEEENITLEPSKMYPDTAWCSFWIPTTQNMFYREKIDVLIEKDEIDALIQSGGINQRDYRIAIQHDGYTIHCISESIAYRIADAIDYAQRSKDHDEANAWMYGD